MNRRQWMVLSGSALAMRAGEAQEARDAAADKAAKTPDKLLLKDYRPVSIYRVPATQIQRARYPVIDAHYHAEWIRTPEEADGIVRLMDAVGVEKTVLFVRTGSPERFAENAKTFANHPSRFDLWCGFHMTGYDQPGFDKEAVRLLEGCHRAGALGVGEIIDKGEGFYGSKASKAGAPGLHPDDPRLDAVYDKCGALGMPINMHVSDPIWSYQPMDETNDGLMNGFDWTIHLKPGMLGHDQLIESLERAVGRHPRTIFIACHLANLDYDLTRLGQMFDRHPNLYADIGARFGETAPIARFVAKFLQRYPDRVLYGTDMSYTQGMFSATFRILESDDDHFYVRGPDVGGTGGFNYHWPFYGFGLPDELLKKVYADNARAVFERARNSAT